MTFVNIAPLGGYVTGDLIDESEINYWCAALPDCMDGAQGGTYNLSNPLIVQGDDFEVDDLIVNDSIIADTATIDTATIDEIIGGGLGGLLQVTGDLTVSDSLGVTGSAIFSGNVTLGNAAADTITLNGVLGGGTGRVLETAIIANDADQSIDVLSYRNIVVPSTVTATRTYTLTASGAVDGDWFTFKNLDTAGQQLAGVSSLLIAAGFGVKYVRISGVWQVVDTWAS